MVSKSGLPKQLVHNAWNRCSLFYNNASGKLLHLKMPVNK